MAKQNRVIPNIPPIPQEEPSGDTPSAETPAQPLTGQVDLTPLDVILHQLGQVATGGSIVTLRQTVHDVFPTDKEAAEALLKTLKRLHNTTEVVFQAANEAYAFLLNKR